MYRTLQRIIPSVFIPVALTFAAAIGRADDAANQGNQPARAQAQAQAQAQANPKIDEHRQQVEQEARKTLDQDAVAAIDETRNALKAITSGKSDEALAAIERGTGKINVLVARNPATALIPVEVKVEVIDVAPLDVKLIKEIAKEAERAIKDRDYPAARILLQSLISEIRVRTYTLPLATYPIALQAAARLLDQKQPDEAKTVLKTALNTLVAIDRVSPLPIVVAETAIDQAQALRDKDKDAAQQHLALAKAELERAKELGYAGNDPEYAALNQAISDVEKQLKGNENSTSAFAKLKEKVSSFFHRMAGSVKKSEVASR
jgi:hypothetical protein